MNTTKNVGVFKNQGKLPITNECIINQVADDSALFYVSYNPSARDYGSATTAIVIKSPNVFLVLNGDHREHLGDNIKNLSFCIDYYVKNIGESNSRSEDRLLLKSKDVFWSKSELCDAIGLANYKKLRAAIFELAK